MSIIKLLNKKINRAIFATPSHSQNPLFSKEYKDFYKKDVSEYSGFDNLSNPHSSIFFAQGKASDIIGSKHTFFITQGATTAILASIKSIVEPNDKVLVARNCHKSVFNGLILSNCSHDWFMPDFSEEWGIYTKIDTKKLNSILDINNYKAFILTSPTYEGVNSNIEEISKICKSHGVYLIVDESHGTLNNFSDLLPKSAIKSGADISINSLHKTAGALNQCAILNVSKNIFNLDIEKIQNTINMFHTTSPSYPLLSNIESCINFLSSQNGKKEIKKLLENIETIKIKLKNFDIEFFDDENLDKTKILLRKKGLDSVVLSDELFDKYNIEDEFTSPLGSLFICGIGTKKTKLKKLESALKNINFKNPEKPFKLEQQPIPIVKFKPFETFIKKSVLVNSQNAVGKVSAQTILPYPPGIGLLYPGEKIQEWHMKYLDENVEVFE